MERIIDMILTAIPGILLGLGSLLAAILSNRKNKIASNDELDKAIDQKFEEKCSECAYKREYNINTLFLKEMYEAEGVFEELYQLMKTHFLALLNKYYGKTNYFDLAPYIKFNLAWEYTREALLVETRKIFKENDIEKLTHDEIEKRAETRLYNIITTVFDDIYKDVEKPDRLELFEATKLKKLEYINILSGIYDRALVTINRFKEKIG